MAYCNSRSDVRGWAIYFPVCLLLFVGVGFSFIFGLQCKFNEDFCDPVRRSRCEDYQVDSHRFVSIGENRVCANSHSSTRKAASVRVFFYADPYTSEDSTEGIKLTIDRKQDSDDYGNSYYDDEYYSIPYDTLARLRRDGGDYTVTCVPTES